MLTVLFLAAIPPLGQPQSVVEAPQAFALPARWIASEPLVQVQADRLPASPDNPWLAVKDPSIVRHQGRWHLFCTLRQRDGGDGKPPGYIRIGYLSFADWSQAHQADWTLLDLSLDYHGAPQVFYFQPHRKWYLIYQLADASRGVSYGPCYSTTENLGDPKSWTAPEPLYDSKPAHVPGWVDFWVICDDQRAHLFFSSLNGTLWRASTRIADFPSGFGPPEVALKGDFFEASHTYRLGGEQPRYLTLIEAQNKQNRPGRRYYQAYTATDLAGPWKPLASTYEQPFAGPANVSVSPPSWTDSVSHGELIRVGVDERLEVDPQNLQFLFQGVPDNQWGAYGKLAWRLGLLRPAK